MSPTSPGSLLHWLYLKSLMLLLLRWLRRSPTCKAEPPLSPPYLSFLLSSIDPVFLSVSCSPSCSRLGLFALVHARSAIYSTEGNFCITRLCDGVHTVFGRSAKEAGPGLGLRVEPCLFLFLGLAWCTGEEARMWMKQPARGGLELRSSTKCIYFHKALGAVWANH